MKRILFLVFIVVGLRAHAGILYGVNLNAAVTTLHTTFSVADATDISVPNARPAGSMICIYNNTAALVAANVDNDLASVAPTADVNDLYLPTGTSFCLPPVTRFTRTILLRSASGGNIVTGNVIIEVLDRRG